MNDESEPMFRLMKDGKPFISSSGSRLVNDGEVYFEWKEGKEVIGSENNVHAALLRVQGQSNDYAIKYGGWSVEPYKTPYGWVITEDHISEDDEKDTGTAYPPNADTELIAKNGKEFRLLDADDHLYYTGKILIPENDEPAPQFTAMGGVWDDEWEWHPLRWAQSYAGCTDIQYKNDAGEWESL